MREVAEAVGASDCFGRTRVVYSHRACTARKPFEVIWRVDVAETRSQLFMNSFGVLLDSISETFLKYVETQPRHRCLSASKRFFA